MGRTLVAGNYRHFRRPISCWLPPDQTIWYLMEPARSQNCNQGVFYQSTYRFIPRARSRLQARVRLDAPYRTSFSKNLLVGQFSDRCHFFRIWSSGGSRLSTRKYPRRPKYAPNIQIGQVSSKEPRIYTIFVYLYHYGPLSVGYLFDFFITALVIC